MCLLIVPSGSVTAPGQKWTLHDKCEHDKIKSVFCVIISAVGAECSRRAGDNTPPRCGLAILITSPLCYHHLLWVWMGLLQLHAIQIDCGNLHNVRMISRAEVFSGFCNPVCVEQIRFITSCGNLSMFGNFPARLFRGRVVRDRTRWNKNKRLWREGCVVRLLLMLYRFNEITLNTSLTHYPSSSAAPLLLFM